MARFLKPKVLILTDGKIGDLVQCRGIASRLAPADEIIEQVIKPDWLHSLPLPLMPVQRQDRKGQPGSLFNAAPPDLVLASGRRTIPYLRYYRSLRSNDHKPMMVFLKDPRLGRNIADFIWAPKHDNLAGADVLTTHTSPHGLSKEALSKASQSASLRFDKYKGPTAGIILGGDSGSVKWDEKSSAAFAQSLLSLPEKETLLVTPSRRTPACLIDAVKDIGNHRNMWFWNNQGDNPYVEILTHADRLIVTGDSHNMVSECLALGTPVHVYKPPNLQRKLVSFLDEISKLQAIKPVGDWKPFKPVRIDATDEIAEKILEKLTLFYQSENLG